MAKKDSYREYLRQDFQKVIDTLNLPELKKHFLTARWLEQVLWMEVKSGKSQKRYYAFRVTTIIGGIILPALVSLNITDSQVRVTMVWATFFLSQVVAISAAIEEFFHYGERWKHYRRTCESLKNQGWLFFQLSGPYINYKNHEQAFSVFANQVEDILHHDVEVYSTQVVQENKKEENDKHSENDLPERAKLNLKAESAALQNGSMS